MAEGVNERVETGLEHHRLRLFGYALSLTGTRSDAEDLLQECAVRALAADSIPRSRLSMRAWLFRIMRNAWIDQHRRRQIVPMTELNDADPSSGDLWKANEALLDTIAVGQALTQLPLAAREILSLIDMAGFSYAEVAEILEIPLGTVMSRVSRARQAMLSIMFGTIDPNDDKL